MGKAQEQQFQRQRRRFSRAFRRRVRPGNFWTKLLEDPLVSTFSGVKLAHLQGFSFFPDRRVILSVGVRNPTEIEVNATEALIRDACLEEARAGFDGFSGEFESFDVIKQGTDTKVSRLMAISPLENLIFPDLAERVATLKMGRTGDGGYAVIIGGVVDRQGKLENHGRWLPYPMLVPMMVGTAMSLEKDYYSSDAAYEIGQLSQQMLLGTWNRRNGFVPFYWAAHQLARKMNFMQMAELTQSCPDLQAVFDLAALIRMRNGPLAEATGKIKSAKRKALFPPRAKPRPSSTFRNSSITKRLRKKNSRKIYESFMPLPCSREIPPPSSSSWRVTRYTTKTGTKSLPRPLSRTSNWP